MVLAASGPRVEQLQGDTWEPVLLARLAPVPRWWWWWSVPSSSGRDTQILRAVRRDTLQVSDML